MKTHDNPIRILAAKVLALAVSTCAADVDDTLTEY